jgi:hypothetical protein
MAAVGREIGMVDEKSVVDTIAEEVVESARAVIAEVKAIAAEVTKAVADHGNPKDEKVAETPASVEAPKKTRRGPAG